MLSLIRVADLDLNLYLIVSARRCSLIIDPPSCASVLVIMQALKVLTPILSLLLGLCSAYKLERASVCKDVRPIQETEFIRRQNNLANVLHSHGYSAYIMEPSSNGLYFANVSTEQWHLSERPFLVVITPDSTKSRDQITFGGVMAKVTILTPTFEASRAKLLSIPGDVSYIQWNEDASPYEALTSLLGDGKVALDQDTRHLILQGLKSTFKNEFLFPSIEMRSMRIRKSEPELAIIRCVAQSTVKVLQYVSEKVKPGMKESEVSVLISNSFQDLGFENRFALVLFGENAALPHGGPADTVLDDSSLVLADVGASLYGYESDITRTFATSNTIVSKHQQHIFDIVQNAQKAAIDMARVGRPASSVDIAARNVTSEAGLATYFTHRLGHGVGLQGHEEPYLNKGNHELLLDSSVFTTEPGLYIEGDIGVRLEDMVTVTHNGIEILSGSPQKSLWEL